MSSEAAEIIGTFDLEGVTIDESQKESKSILGIPTTAKRYARSKLAGIMLASTLSKRLAPEILVNSCHPGIIATGIGRTAYAFVGETVMQMVNLLQNFIGLSKDDGVLTILV